MQPSPLVPLHHTHSCGVSQTCYHSHSPSPLSPSQRIQSFRSRFLQNIGPSRSNPKSQAQNYKQIHNLNNSNSFDHSLSLSLTGTTMAISRQIMRYSSPSSSPIFKSLLNQTIRFNHNHQEQEYNKPCDFLGSWEQPKTPREAEKKLGLLRRDYAKQVKELRKEYFYEMELQRQEKQRKDEAKREATLVAKEERKVAKAAMLQVKAAERKASEEELRQTLLKERAEKLEYWRLKNKRVEEKKREKNEIIRCQSSIWIDELNLENKVLEAIVDTTPL